jgi:hypothetical protein
MPNNDNAGALRRHSEHTGQADISANIPTPSIPYSAIPSELRDRSQWVNWRYDTVDGKLTKVPYKPWGEAKASTTQPATWGTFEAARGHQREGFDGIGFVFREDGGLAGVDLDHCRDADGNIAPWAAEIIRDLDSYSEVSPSGRGVHIIVRGALPGGGNKRAYETGAVEMYARGRYFTMTGDHLDGTPDTVNPRTVELAVWHQRLFAPPAPAAVTSQSNGARPLRSDDEIIRRAMAAPSGGQFRALLQGDISGYASQSEADLALCSFLAWAGGDEAAIDRIIRRCPLYREDKWERDDYRARTIGKAVQSVADRKQPTGQPKMPTTHEDAQSEDRGHLRDESEGEDLTDYPGWPDSMRDEAYIGPIGKWVKKIAPQTEAAREGLLIQALAAAGNAMGRHGRVTVEADDHHTNLFVVPVGDTGARKGVGWKQVRRFLHSAVPDWVDDHIKNGLSTGEGLIHAVRDEEPPIPDKVLLAMEPEFAAVFNVKRRDGNTLSAVLRQAWDGDTLSAMTRTNPIKSTGAHISIVGHITPAELRAVMTGTDAGNGFANRFLWCCVKRARYLPHGGETVNVNAETAALREGVEYGKLANQVKRNAESNRLWEQRYRDLSSGRPGLLGAVTNRAEAQVTRLALIYALLDKSADITCDHLRAALAV